MDAKMDIVTQRCGVQTQIIQFRQHSNILTKPFEQPKNNPSTWHILRMTNLKESL